MLTGCKRRRCCLPCHVLDGWQKECWRCAENVSVRRVQIVSFAHLIGSIFAPWGWLARASRHSSSLFDRASAACTAVLSSHKSSHRRPAAPTEALSAIMFVVKRSGKRESVHFDKITSRVSKLCYGLDSKVRTPIDLLYEMQRRRTFRPWTTDGRSGRRQNAQRCLRRNARSLPILFCCLTLACGAGDHLSKGHSGGVSWSYDLRARRVRLCSPSNK